jgi:glycosyltransferase involved in cell wall biosynthesis
MEVILDCERMKYPHTGLFEYCHQLGLALLETKEKTDILDIYIQKKDKLYFPAEIKTYTQRSVDKYIFPRLAKEAHVWHAAHQTSWYMPPKDRKIKRVVTIHDLNFLYEEKSESRRMHYLRRHQKNIDLADHIVAISEFTKADVLRHLKVDKPISVIYNGCNVGLFPNYNRPTYRPFKPFIFALGTVNAKKNFHVLSCLVQSQDLELVIAGNTDKDYVEKIVKVAIHLGVNDRVKIIGPISTEDKYWYYKNCAAFALPSIAEGFGIPVIEAMTFGKPVFLSMSTSLPEIGGKYAYYFENFDPEYMQRTFEQGMNDYEKNRPQEAIIKYASQFNWKRAARAYWQVYHSL